MTGATIANIAAGMLAALIFAFLAWRLLKSPCNIAIDSEGINLTGLFSWSNQERLLFSDIRRFEERYIVPPIAKISVQAQGTWHLFAIIASNDKEIRRELPNDGKDTFRKLKVALTEWQTAHGCVQPTPLAELSNTVRY